MNERVNRDSWRRIGGISLCLVAVLGAPVSASPVDDAVRQEVRENDQSKASQDRIDALSDDIDAMAAEYRTALQDTRALEVYDRQLAALVSSQRAERESLERQMDNVTVVGRQVMPLMERMIDTLDTFVEVDLPFLPDERHARIEKLREMMQRADVTISEKYRRVLEAYQIENEYGRTIEAYRGNLGGEEGERVVDFLRVGRNALLYQTLDGEESGVWDATARQWKTLGDEYRTSIREGLRIARKQVAPDLLLVPLPAPEEAK